MMRGGELGQRLVPKWCQSDKDLPAVLFAPMPGDETA